MNSEHSEPIDTLADAIESTETTEPEMAKHDAQANVTPGPSARELSAQLARMVVDRVRSTSARAAARLAAHPRTSTVTAWVTKHRRMIFTVGAGVAAGALITGMAAAAMPPDMVAVPGPTVTKTKNVAVEHNVYVPGPTITVTKTITEAPKAPDGTTTVIKDGTWVVGSDIGTGTYKVTAAVTSRCYWEIDRSGTNGSDIIDNDIPGGGLPQVTLSVGQDFKSSNCGTWTKIG
jgi:hypothetical protein